MNNRNRTHPDNATGQPCPVAVASGTGRPYVVGRPSGSDANRVLHPDEMQLWPDANQIEQHPDYAAIMQRWYSVCLAAGRDPQTAMERAKGYAYAFISKQIRSREYLRKHIGPNVEATA